MTRVALLTLLLAACDGATTSPPPSPASTPAPTPADKPASTPTPAETPEPEGAGFASPQQADDDTKPAPPTGAPPEPELVARIKERYGDGCKYERACGDLVGIDCGAAVDGPYYYATRKDLEKVATCGGACRRGCTDCPPKAWTCPTY